MIEFHCQSATRAVYVVVDDLLRRRRVVEGHRRVAEPRRYLVVKSLILLIVVESSRGDRAPSAEHAESFDVLTTTRGTVRR